MPLLQGPIVGDEALMCVAFFDGFVPMASLVLDNACIHKHAVQLARAYLPVGLHEYQNYAHYLLPEADVKRPLYY